MSCPFDAQVNLTLLQDADFLLPCSITSARVGGLSNSETANRCQDNQRTTHTLRRLVKGAGVRGIRNAKQRVLCCLDN